MRTQVAPKEHGPIKQSELLHRIFKRNVPADRLRTAREELEAAGLARRSVQDTAGRSATVWAAE